jgi:exodeoxyribonuclease VII small subunit
MTAKRKSFEDALRDLEAVVAALEKEDVTLDDALGHFERGVGLMRTCDEHLRNAEGKLKELIKGKDGAYAERILGSMLSILNDEGASDE